MPLVLPLLLPGLLASVEPAASAEDTVGEIVVVVSGLRSDSGKVYASLYDGPDGFPTNADKSRRGARASISGGKARLRFGSVNPGTYAIAVFHDENGNKTLDTNWIGIPSEGVGASNNAAGRFGPPKYKDAKFTVGTEQVVQRIRVLYL